MQIIDTFKNLLGFGNSEEQEFNTILNQCIDDQIAVTDYFYKIIFNILPTYKETIKNWDDSKKARYIVYLCRVALTYDTFWNSSNVKNHRRYSMAVQCIHAIFNAKMALSEAELQAIYTAFNGSIFTNDFRGVPNWPLSNFFKQIEHNYAKKELPISLVKILEDIVVYKKNSKSYYYKEQVKLDEKIKGFLFGKSSPEISIVPAYFIGEDGFSAFANALINKQQDADRDLWFKLMHSAKTASGSKPAQKFLKETKSIIDTLGSDKFLAVTREWFDFLTGMKEKTTTITSQHGSGTYSYNAIEFLDPVNMDLLKAWVWMTSSVYDKEQILCISRLAERCFKKIPDKGPAALSVGNACLYTLFASPGLDGIAQLSKLKIRVKQPVVTTLIDKYINEAAQNLGITGKEVEDLAVDDFDLQEKKLTQQFGDTTCVLELTGIGKSILKWYKKDGSEQKTVPQSVKDDYADAYKKLKDTQKQIDQTTAVQKDRLDRQLRSDVKMTVDYFKDKYINHPLLSCVIDKVIFSFSNETASRLGIYLNKQWIDLHRDPINIDQYTQVILWHPVTSTTSEVREWRQFLMDAQIQQPFKQAYREIYLLTEAEINTRTYSNRMASHILKQHQYVTLAKGRHWKATLIGSWDGGDQDTAVLHLPDYGLKVEFWVNALNIDNEFNPTGIWNYVTTDQVRFVRTETNALVELIQVPPVAFSEAMRDVDLFVGVASVGNDPNWTDSGGLPVGRDYWQSYAFGDLSEIAKNRKEILQSLIPRLKIAAVTTVSDKFVIVKGKLRTYKIHIGSSNILMEPNDQYLCIVPDRSKKDEAIDIFLPFEGDNGLSVIISKAFLLANDDKITDSSITSQIKRR